MMEMQSSFSATPAIVDGSNRSPNKVEVRLSELHRPVQIAAVWA
jgi:hypothetical protein